MAELTRKDLAEKKSLKIEKVNLGKGDFVYIKEMMGQDRELYEVMIMKEIKDRQGDVTYENDISFFKSKLIVCCLCDEKGINLYKPQEYKEFSMNVSANWLMIIFKACAILNAVDEEAKEKLAKNLKGDQSDDSSSDSVKS